MAKRTQGKFYGEHAIAYALLHDDHLSSHGRLMSAYLSAFGVRDSASPRDARIMQALNIDAARLEELKAEIQSHSKVWTVESETRYGSVYQRRGDIRQDLSLPDGWRSDWRFDIGRQAGLRWLSKYSIEAPSHTLILLTLALTASLDQTMMSRVPSEHFAMMDTEPDLEEALSALRARGFIEFSWTHGEGLYVRWSAAFASALHVYVRTWFAPKKDSVSAEVAYGSERWRAVGRPLPSVQTREEIWYFYTLSDPRTGLIRYAGISLDPHYRMLNNYGTGMEISNRASKNRDFTAWLQGLRDQGLDPIHEIQHEMSVAGTRSQAEEFEGEWVRQLHREGHPLLNIEHIYVAPRS